MNTIVSKISHMYPHENEQTICIYLDIAISLILEYLNNLNINITDSEVIEKYENALVLLLINTIDNSKDKGISSKKQGNKSITYTGNRKMLALTSEVKALLPSTPVIRLMG
ncbi:MAG: hypothetical protein ACRCX8_05960 [Sarcina sp.]